MAENNGNGKYKLTIEHRITKLEVAVEEMLENHLPHLQARVDKIQWLLLTTLAGVVTGLIMQILR